MTRATLRKSSGILRTPTEVLIRIGQIEVMNMTKMAEGWPSRKAARANGSQASGGTVRRI